MDLTEILRDRKTDGQTDTLLLYYKDEYMNTEWLQEYAPVWLYQFNYKHNHSLAAFDLNNPGKALKEHTVMILILVLNFKQGNVSPSVLRWRYN